VEPVCSAIKRDGGRCTQGVKPGQTWCYNHDPARAEDRKRAASRAARSKPSRELSDIKRRLSELADNVLAGTVDRGDGAVVSQVLNVYLRAITTELKVKETVELEERLERLEAAAGARVGAVSSWR
jgi:hypothetical protein